MNIEKVVQNLLAHRWTHFMVLLVFVVVTRFYLLGSVPSGLAWDEAAIGYNGYAVITARRDEWLNRLPVSFRSFGDYKAPLAIYVDGMSVVLLGSSALAVRLPFAVMGVVAVVALVGWIYQLLLLNTFEDKRAWELSLVAGWLMAISPWHLHYSRVAFESGFALSWVLLGAWSLTMGWRMLEKKQQDVRTWALLTTGFLAWVAALYTYHSARLVVPLLGVGLVVLWGRQVWQRPALLWRWTTVVLISAVATLPLLKDMVVGSGQERFRQASVLAQLPFFEGLTTVVWQWLLHLDPRFLGVGVTPSLRHGVPGFGVLSPIEAVLVLCGVLGLVMGSISGSRKKLWWLGAAWAAVGLLPAAIGVDVTHSNRALLASPGFIVMAIIGLEWVLDAVSRSAINGRILGTHKERHLVVKSVIGMVVLLCGLWFLHFWQFYLNRYPALATTAFSDGYMELFKILVPLEKGQAGKPKPQQIMVTSRYGQPYIYALLAKRTNPIWYQGGTLNTYFFSDKISISDLERPGTIVVASGQDEMPFERAEYTVKGADGSVRFAVFLPQELK